MEKELLDHQKELQLLPPPPPLPPTHPSSSSSSSRALSWLPARRSLMHRGEPSLDLKLSISLGPPQPAPDAACIEALKWQAAEQIRMAAIEKAYAERVRELTKREIELAQSEFARARAVWDKARDEVARVERLRDSANTCMAMGEITCHSCRQRKSKGPPGSKVPS